MDLNGPLVRAAHLHSPRGPCCVTPLGDSALFLRDRFLATGYMADLQKAISSGQMMLELCPQGHPDRAMALYIRSITLLDRFRRQETYSDLNHAIMFGQEALRLGSPEFFNQSVFSTLLASYYQQRGETLSPPLVLENPSSALVKQTIWDDVINAMAAFPPRLVNTHTGIIYDRSTQLSQFEHSPEYNELLALAIKNTVTTQVVQAVVFTYFQYVMLSHHWGNDEPLLRDIKGHVIYDMPSTGGLRKLQGLCYTARQRGYAWVWSDTCCINSDSTVEVQEAIGSMFSWYLKSALTIVYLADVSAVDSLSSSIWFKRGWTLQELLAPRTILFFTHDWSVYRTFSNHKQDRTILDLLESATGISRECLIDFCSCTVSARTKLQWAALRRTTRPQDVAYALFGIFRLHLPFMYVETKEDAIGRLLEEIMSRSGDISILNWAGEGSSYHSCFPSDITSYHTVLPLQDFQGNTVERPSIFWKILSFRTAWKLRRTLSELSPPQMINHRLILSCIVHPVKTLRRQPSCSNTEGYIYQIEATGLRPLEITLPDRLRERSRYFLIRPWDSRQLDLIHEADASAVYSWVRQLTQPFSAVLINEFPHKEYRRIASPHTIMAYPVDKASILKSDIRTLHIV